MNLIKLQYHDNITWQTFSSEEYAQDISFRQAWDLLNDNTEVIWQQL